MRQERINFTSIAPLGWLDKHGDKCSGVALEVDATVYIDGGDRETQPMCTMEIDSIRWRENGGMLPNYGPVIPDENIQDYIESIDSYLAMDQINSDANDEIEWLF